MEAKDFDLYFKGQIIDFGDGTGLLERKELAYTPSPGDKFHKVIGGETITKIAWKEYKDQAGERAPFYWKYIVAANPSIMNPLDLTEFVGKMLIIPDFNLMKLSE
jgi:hypothetical protein